MSAILANSFTHAALGSGTACACALSVLRQEERFLSGRAVRAGGRLRCLIGADPEPSPQRGIYSPTNARPLISTTFTLKIHLNPHDLAEPDRAFPPSTRKVPLEML
jgi:hypothetical protein